MPSLPPSLFHPLLVLLFNVETITEAEHWLLALLPLPPGMITVRVGGREGGREGGRSVGPRAVRQPFFLWLLIPSLPPSLPSFSPFLPSYPPSLPQEAPQGGFIAASQDKMIRVYDVEVREGGRDGGREGLDTCQG